MDEGAGVAEAEVDGDVQGLQGFVPLLEGSVQARLIESGDRPLVSGGADLTSRGDPWADLVDPSAVLADLVGTKLQVRRVGQNIEACVDMSPIRLNRLRFAISIAGFVQVAPQPGDVTADEPQLGSADATLQSRRRQAVGLVQAALGQLQVGPRQGCKDVTRAKLAGAIEPYDRRLLEAEQREGGADLNLQVGRLVTAAQHLEVDLQGLRQASTDMQQVGGAGQGVGAVGVQVMGPAVGFEGRRDASLAVEGEAQSLVSASVRWRQPDGLLGQQGSSLGNLFRAIELGDLVGEGKAERCEGVGMFGLQGERLFEQLDGQLVVALLLPP